MIKPTRRPLVAGASANDTSAAAGTAVERPKSFPAGKPRLLIVGGAGQALSTAVVTVGQMGYHVTVVGRRPLRTLQRTTLLAGSNVRYEALDVFAPDSQVKLGELAAGADIVVMGAEPHVVSDAAQLHGIIAGVERLYGTLNDAGYTIAANHARRRVKEWPQRVVRIGSPPAELPSRSHLGRSGFVEDATSFEELRLRAADDVNWKNPYFQAKVGCAAAAHRAVADGLDIVTAAPTSVISWAGDWGEREPIIQFREYFRRSWLPFIPSTLTNVVPGDVVACGVMLTALAGKTGEYYQLAGVDMETAECVQGLLAVLGEVTPPPRRYSRAELDYQVRLLDGESLTRTAREVVDYGSRAVANVGLLWVNALSLGMLTPLVATTIAADVVTGGASAMRNAYDNVVTTTLRGLGLESWQIALLAEMQTRRADKIRTLNAAVAGTRFGTFAYPEQSEIAKQIPSALRRQAAWFQERGLLPPQERRRDSHKRRRQVCRSRV